MKKVLGVILIVCILLLGLCSCTIEIVDVDTKSKEAKAVLEYLDAANGLYVLSGQQESTWMSPQDYEFEYLKTNTGKLPAIRGFDYINDDFDGVNERAIKWWNDGGIVSICWHTGKNYSGGYDDCKDDEVENWDSLLTEGTDEYNQMIEGIDKAAGALKVLKDNNVPVMWRPYHEAFGDWFWWGKGEDNQDRASHYKKLWQIMYTRYTDYWKLDNLIWVLGFSHMNYDWDSKPKDRKGADKWNPGSQYYDLIGADSYVDGVHVQLNDVIKKINKQNKPMAYHECGKCPTVEELQGTSWSYFLTWHTTYLVDANTVEELNALYNSDYVITLDELPNFKA